MPLKLLSNPPEKASSPPGESHLQPFLVTATEAAKIFQKSARTWHNWNATGKVPRAIRVGRSVFWRREEIEAWFAAGCPDRETWEQRNRDRPASDGLKELLKLTR